MTGLYHTAGKSLEVPGLGLEAGLDPSKYTGPRPPTLAQSSLWWGEIANRLVAAWKRVLKSFGVPSYPIGIQASVSPQDVSMVGIRVFAGVIQDTSLLGSAQTSFPLPLGEVTVSHSIQLNLKAKAEGRPSDSTRTKGTWTWISSDLEASGVQCQEWWFFASQRPAALCPDGTYSCLPLPGCVTLGLPMNLSELPSPYL